jgi:hypothetical protein
LHRKEDGGSTAVRNVGIQPPQNTAQHPRKPQIFFTAVKTSTLEIVILVDFSRDCAFMLNHTDMQIMFQWWALVSTVMNFRVI